MIKKTGGYVKDILELLDEPKAHNHIVATLPKIWVEKGVIEIKNANRNNLYYPLVTKYTYSEQSIEQLTKSYFERLNCNVVSFVVDKKQMSIEDLELVLKELKNKLNCLLKVDELIAKTYCNKVFT
ncbi:BlaI/MecI/CopY family transcriptional regulator [Daejeonella sp.]|jgi:BlaI family penicillinase repressor|uniref:BlaI/MecI/CopY family transcriptional regulator n=1 Tax=Daejeonella sp. TaxID=2805397 RepID=UPI0037C0120F